MIEPEPLMPETNAFQSPGLQSFFSESSMERLFSIMIPKKLKKGARLFREGEKADYIYYIKKGRIKISKSAETDVTFTLNLYREGELFASGDVLTNSRHLLDATAAEDCELGMILREDLENLLRQHGDFAVEFMRWQSTMHLLTQTKFRDLMMFGKLGALSSLLIRFNNTYGEPFGAYSRISVKINNIELAQMIGATRESVNRMLSDMKRKGIIDKQDGHLIIKDLNYLRDICHCEHCSSYICRV